MPGSLMRSLLRVWLWLPRNPCRARVDHEKNPAGKRTAGHQGRQRWQRLLELVRHADIEPAAVLLPRQHLPRIVVLVGNEGLVGQVGTLRDQGQALEPPAFERVADLSVVAAAALDGLLDARGADARYFAQEAGAVAVADARFETVVLVVK